MIANLGAAQFILLLMVLLDAAAALWLFARRWARRIVERRRACARCILQELPDELGKAQRRFVRRHRWLFLRECAWTSDGVRLPEAHRAALARLLEAAEVDIALLRDLNAAQRFHRMRAASYLPWFPRGRSGSV